MISLLARILIKDWERMEQPSVRAAYGILSGAVGIFLNICLFLFKFIAGMISGSIAITADAFNNLSDAGSSVITLLGFKMANAKPDPEHPYGHGRIEYISGLFVSIFIILMAFELLKSSVEKMIHPEALETSSITIVILVASVLVKFYMMLYNQNLGKKLQSSTMKATAKDSLSDMLSTTAVLASTLIYGFFSINIDAYCGVLVGIFIFYTGISSLIETINPLLGQAPDSDFVAKIEEIVGREREILGIHDLVVHDYGPGRVMVSLHAEVSANKNMLETHDMIDNMERLLEKELNCPTTIHMDPIQNDDETTKELREQIGKILNRIDTVLTMHDFRIVPGTTHTNIIFDLVLPYGYPKTQEEIVKQIEDEVKKMGEQYYVVITVDRK